MSGNKTGHDVSRSALVNLKAELYRKQEQFRQKKQAQASAGVPVGYAAITTKKIRPEVTKKVAQVKNNPGVNQRNEKDLAERAEDERSWEKAKTVLANKAKLYDKLSSEQYIPGEDEEHMLVDFSRKTVDHKPRDTFPNTASDDSDESDTDIGPIPPPVSISEEWVEYEDHLGRSRKCLRKDLPHMMAEKERMRQDLENLKRLRLSGGVSEDLMPSRDSAEATGFDFGNAPLDERTLLSNDMRREMDRQNWEKTASDARNEDDYSMAETEGRPGPITYNPHPQGPVHYETIKNNEIREMGVGYYKFSTDSVTRQQELDQLQRLQDQTTEQRSQKEQLKAKRKALADARLAKIRAKKNLPAETTATKDDDDDLAEFEELLKPPPVQPTPSAEELLAARGGVRQVRPWDKGKENANEHPEENTGVFFKNGAPPGMELPAADKPNDKTYFSKRREERNDEFAPPDIYAASSKKTHRSPVAGFVPGPKNAFPRPSTSSEFYKNVPPPGQSFAAPSVVPSGFQPGPASSNYKPWEELHETKAQSQSSDYKPWENLQPAGKRKLDERRPFANAPPPEMYSRDTRPMSFGHVDEAEIREQARKLFASNIRPKEN